MMGNALSIVLLAATECVRLGQHSGAELMHITHGSEGDEANECILWHHGKGLLQGIFSLLQFLLDQSNVQHKQEHWRTTYARRDDVFDGRAHWEQLCWQVRFINVFCVVRWERISLQAEWASPTLRVEVDHGVGIEHRSTVTRLANHWLVFDQLQTFSGLKRIVEAT
jgi:hypothetical protein